MNCNSLSILAIVTALAATVNAITLVVDICKRHKVISVSSVQVPNKNDGGVEEFGTANAKEILIKSDNTVQIELKDGSKVSYAKFIKWRSQK